MIAFISISDALRLCYDKKGILIDVRPEEEYRAGHLPMAENVPLERIQKGEYPPEEKPEKGSTGYGDRQTARRTFEKTAGGKSAALPVL